MAIPGKPVRVAGHKFHPVRCLKDVWYALDACINEADRHGLHSVGATLKVSDWLGQNTETRLALDQKAQGENKKS